MLSSDCSVSGYYTTPYNPGYLSELTGIMAGDLAVGAGPGVQAQPEEENSDANGKVIDEFGKNYKYQCKVKGCWKFNKECGYKV